MKTRNSLLTVLLILILFALPTLADEGTEEAPVTVTDGGVVIVEVPESDLSQTELVFASLFLVSLLINALQAFFLNKSVPSDLAAKIFAGARLLANATPRPDDNKIVDEAEKLYNDLHGAKS
jgi:hypothetical protein